MKSTCIEKISKNQLFKNKVIIKYDDLKDKLSSILESDKETDESNNKSNNLFNVLFEENKFQFKNDFDKEHCKVFLKEKIKYLQPMDLEDSLSEEDEKIEILKRTPTKFTFGHF